MTGSLRLSALLFLLLSRWTSADLEKGEDEFVRSWVIIEEQLVPPSRDELLQIGSVGGGGAVGGATSRRITPKSVFVAPSFNKCSDGYRPDSMGRCVKVVKINQAAQWDFLLKQLNSMYGSGSAGFPVQSGQSAYRPAVTMTTTTAESPLQKTDSPGPFQLNIPLVMDTASPVNNQTATTIDDDEITTGFTSTTTGTITTTNTGTTTTTTTITNNKTPKNTTTASTIVTTTADAEVTDDDDDARTTVRDIINTTTTSDVDDVAVTVTDITTDPSVLITSRPRPYRNRYHQTEQQTAAHTTTSDPPTTTATDAKIKYVESSSRATNVETDDSSQTIKTTTTINTPSSSTPSAVTTTTVGVTEADDLATISTMTTTEADDDEDVVTVLAVAAVDGDRPSLTRFPVSDMKTQLPQVVDTVTPEYYDDQPEVPISVSEPPSPDCSSQDAYLYYVECMDFRQQQLQQQQQQQQQQFQQLHQQQLLIQQQQQQQHHQQLYQQQQHQQQQQQLYNQQQFQLAPHNHVAGALVKRPAAIGGGVQIRFPEEGSGSVTVADHANLIRFPGPAPYRTTNKMYESSRHPTWWPTGWPEQQPQPGNGVQQQQQQQQQYHLQQNHPSQQKQDARYWEFGSRLPKSTTTSTTTTVVPPPPPPPPPSQWFRRYF